MEGSRILVAEDDQKVRDAVARPLRFEGFDVLTASNGAEALALTGQQRPDAIVLDIMMPRVDGLDVCRSLRAAGNKTPVLILTARATVTDRVEGLDAGADDYLVKPFALEEMLARVRALLRRTDVPAGVDELRLADLVIDLAGRRVTRGDREVELTKTEFDLLELLVRNAGIVLSRDRIYEDIWGYNFETSSKSLDVYIGYLRRKTEAGGERRLIHTVRGVGYRAAEV